MENPFFLEGNQVALCPLNSDHIPLYAKWINIAQVRKYARRTFPTTLDQIKKDLEQPSSQAPEDVRFEIWYKPENCPVGQCGIHHISWHDLTGTVGLGIGEPDYWSRGIASEVGKLLLQYVFTELNLHKILAYIFSPNVASQHAAENAGMTLETTLKEMVFIDGQYFDDFIYSCTREEWLRQNGTKSGEE